MKGGTMKETRGDKLLCTSIGGLLSPQDFHRRRSRVELSPTSMHTRRCSSPRRRLWTYKEAGTSTNLDGSSPQVFSIFRGYLHQVALLD